MLIIRQNAQIRLAICCLDLSINGAVIGRRRGYGRLLLKKKKFGLKFRKFHVPIRTVHSGCTDPT